jgi:hypothetical protein
MLCMKNQKHLLVRKVVRASIVCVLCSLDDFVDSNEHQPNTAVRFNLMLYRPLPNPENVPVKAPPSGGRQRSDSDVIHVARRARARRPESVDRLQLWRACPPQIALGCLRSVVTRDTTG